jgi:hypothetical protein
MMLSWEFTGILFHSFGNYTQLPQLWNTHADSPKRYLNLKLGLFLSVIYVIISDNKSSYTMGKHSHSVDFNIISRIRAAGPEQVFTPRQFLDLGGRDAVDKALSRHCSAGTLHRLARGLYHLPRTHPRFGPLPANCDAIANALKSRDAIRLQLSGACAANILGLSTQVPVRLVFLTDGPTRRVTVGKQKIVLRRTTPRNMATAGRPSGLVIQALRWLGKKHVDDKVIAQLRDNLKLEDKAALLEDAHLAPAWIGDIFRQLAKNVKRYE